MERNGTYRKVKFSIQRTNMYGTYRIEGMYRGKKTIVHTKDSEAFDYINDDSNKAKQLMARKHCYLKLVQTAEEAKQITFATVKRGN